MQYKPAEVSQLPYNQPKKQRNYNIIVMKQLYKSKIYKHPSSFIQLSKLAASLFAL